MVSNELIDRIRKCESVAVLTGAGISAESGVATFRDPDGLWQKFNPRELANINAFLKNPTLVQSWYASRRHTVESVEPNPGHHALAKLEELVDLTLITQNVDNLHQRAGSNNVVELHGNILRNYCIECETDQEIEVADDDSPVVCDKCGGLIRPDVVWFGEMLPEKAIRQAQIATMSCDIFMTIGTGAEVYPAADLPIIARNNGAYVVELNTTRTRISDFVDEVIQGPSGETLPPLVDIFTDANEIRH